MKRFFAPLLAAIILVSSALFSCSDDEHQFDNHAIPSQDLEILSKIMISDDDLKKDFPELCRITDSIKFDSSRYIKNGAIEAKDMQKLIEIVLGRDASFMIPARKQLALEQEKFDGLWDLRNRRRLINPRLDQMVRDCSNRVVHDAKTLLFSRARKDY